MQCEKDTKEEIIKAFSLFDDDESVCFGSGTILPSFWRIPSHGK